MWRRSPALLEGSFDDCTVLRDPVEQEARDCLRGLRGSMPEGGGSLVLLWSGHAIPSPADGLRLLARDSGSYDDDGLGAGSDVAAPCAESGASQLLLIVDTCFSGEAVAAGERGGAHHAAVSARRQSTCGWGC